MKRNSFTENAPRARSAAGYFGSISISKRLSTRRTALLGLMALSACGFTPVYGPSGGGLRGAVEVATPSTVEGYRLGTTLIERFGPAEAPRYLLTVTLAETQTTAAQTIDGDSTRFDLNGTANWSLTDVNGMEVAKGTAQTFVSYSATGSTLATQTAERDARERLSLALADIIIADVSLSAP